METTMDILLKLVEASVFALLAYIAWKQRETSKNNEARRIREKAALEAQLAHEKAELETHLIDTQNEAQARLEQVETQQIRIQSEADALRATHDHHAELIRHLARTEEARTLDAARWRELMDNYRISHAEAARITAAANEHVAQAITNQNSMMEIQTTAFGNLKSTVENNLQTIGAKVDGSSDELRLVKVAVDILTQRVTAMIEGRDVSAENTLTELDAIKVIAETIARGMNTVLQRMEQTQTIAVVPENVETNNVTLKQPQTTALSATDETPN